jgi:hypothetical protein
MARLPARRDPGIEQDAFSMVHLMRREHPAWHRVAIGDLVVLLAALDRRDEARATLLHQAEHFPDPEHREEFERIWDAALLGEGTSEASEGIAVGRTDYP